MTERERQRARRKGAGDRCDLRHRPGGALRLADDGLRVLVAGRDAERGAEVVAEIEKNGAAPSSSAPTWATCAGSSSSRRPRRG